MSGVDGFWWTGRSHDQSTHERINASHYPGTRQLCTRCDQPTGRCEDDSIYADGWEGPLCEDCGEAATSDDTQPGMSEANAPTTPPVKTGEG